MSDIPPTETPSPNNEQGRSVHFWISMDARAVWLPLFGVAAILLLAWMSMSQSDKSIITVAIMAVTTLTAGAAGHAAGAAGHAASGARAPASVPTRTTGT
jgi:hypothetical protein